MASNTENLGLLKKNPSTDGADTFNIQTMLNDNWDKLDDNAGTVAQTLANILKPTTPPLIGLPSTTTPDGMFQALGNTGELHVWRKTVVITATKDAYISLGPTIELDSPIIYLGNGDKSSAYFMYEPDHLVIYPSGALDNGTGAYKEYKYYWYDVKFMPGSSPSQSIQLEPSNMPGHYILFHGLDTYYNANTGIERDAWYYIPSDATITVTTSAQMKYNSGVQISKLQKVIGNPAVEAGTTTTYPVSTNPNAYQEGDDAKAAGYVLGDAKRIVFYSGNDRLGFNYGDAITVSDDGKTIDIQNQFYQEWYGSNINNVTVMSGKFIRFSFHNNTDYGTSNPVYFMPSTSKMECDSDYNISAVVQPVTGYAAIPAGTTIEYLGKLGDKTRIQAMNYVGTGTYGSSNAISLTFDFEPKFIAIQRNVSNYDGKTFAIRGMKYLNRLNSDGNNNYAFLTWEGKKVSWYSYKNEATNQMNISGETYIVVAIG